jgi:hypothetical protein
VTAIRTRSPAIVPGPRCGWPGPRCAQPDDWHGQGSGERRSWGFHDVQCQRPSTDIGQSPECSLIINHAPPCDYRVRPCQVRCADPAYYPECRMINGHTGSCRYNRRAGVS